MSSRGKKKTTFAKLNREARLRERREDKQARKRARREESEFARGEARDVPVEGSAPEFTAEPE